MATTQTIRTVPCEQGTISYTLTRKKVKNINLRIKPDGRILVSASPRVPVKYIDDFVISKQDFILKAQEQYRRRQQQTVPDPVSYEDGEKMRLLGKVYTIRVEAVSGRSGALGSIADTKNGSYQMGESAFLQGDNLVICVKNPANVRHKELLIQRWLKNVQTQIFGEIVEEIYERMKEYGVPYPQIKIRSMKTRWGSCQPRKGIITLNSQLTKYPRESIEYVVLHEFAHFIHPDHSKRFWELVTVNMPDWKERRKQLSEP